MRRASKIDKNQPEIVAYMRSLGAYVFHTHDLKNFADTLVVYRGKMMLVEIKDPESAKFPKYFYDLDYYDQTRYIVENHLTDGEKDCMKEVLDRKGNYEIVWNEASVLIAFGI